MTQAKRAVAACSSTTRAVIASGDTGSGTNVIEYITMATEGNGTDFGDIANQNDGFGSATSNQIRGVFCGSNDTSPANTNVIDYVTIASTGNATDFGDTSYASYLCAMTSDSHGGIG